MEPFMKDFSFFLSGLVIGLTITWLINAFKEYLEWDK